MRLTLVTGPAVDPVSLAEARAHLRVTATDEDGLIAGYLLAARQFAETYTRRALVTQTWDLKLDYDWPQERLKDGARFDRIELPRPPLQSVTSITYRDTLDVLQTLASSQYRVAGVSEKRGMAFIEPAYGVTWPEVRDQTETITVRFVAGYDSGASAVNTLPEEIRQAILLLVGHLHANPEAVNVGNIVNEMPFAVEALLFPYRVF